MCLFLIPSTASHRWLIIAQCSCNIIFTFFFKKKNIWTMSVSYLILRPHFSLLTWAFDFSSQTSLLSLAWTSPYLCYSSSDDKLIHFGLREWFRPEEIVKNCTFHSLRRLSPMVITTLEDILSLVKVCKPRSGMRSYVKTSFSAIFAESLSGGTTCF